MNIDELDDVDVKSYRSSTLQGALLRVREELGPDASVLETREVWGGSLGQRSFEVLASEQAVVPSRFRSEKLPMAPSEPVTPSSMVAPSDIVIPPALDTADADERSLVVERIRPAHDEDLRSRLLFGLRESAEGWQSPFVKDEPESVTETLSDSEWAESPAFTTLLTQMTAANVDELTARELLQQAADENFENPAELEQHLVEAVAGELVVRQPVRIQFDRQQVIALVGPTGMGKTTTIAKLAAQFKLMEHGRVGLITVDTYRVGAVDQLQTYADILELPLLVASTPEEVVTGIQELAECDIVLIDTAGCSPHDEPRMKELENLLAVAEPDDTQLVVGATLCPAAMDLTTERFSQAGAQAMILTKLDEASGLGDILRTSRESQLPFTYVCEGQEVPHDIQPAIASELAERVVGVNRVPSLSPTSLDLVDGVSTKQ